jgi:hypothetical protein
VLLHSSLCVLRLCPSQSHNYYGNRTRIVSKISKYPAVLDYWQSVRELDESFYTDLRLQVQEMRNQYSTLHDLLVKNEGQRSHAAGMVSVVFVNAHSSLSASSLVFHAERINNPRGEQGEAGANRRHAFA